MLVTFQNDLEFILRLLYVNKVTNQKSIKAESIDLKTSVI